MVTAVCRYERPRMGVDNEIASRPHSEEAPMSFDARYPDASRAKHCPTAPAQSRGLKLFQPELVEPGGFDGDGTVTPQMSLTDVFERWMVPVLFRKSSHATLTKYRDSLAWWRRLTGDPPVRATDDYTLVRFETGLENAVFRRGKHGLPRPLSQFTRHGHLVRVNVLLAACGPRGERRRVAAGLVDSPPQLVVEAAEAKASPPFTIEQARAIYAAIDQLGGTSKLPATVFRATLRALVSLLYYTGLRIGTVLELRWDHLRLEADEKSWLDVPGELVTKTGKGLSKYLRAEALAACERLRLLNGSTSKHLAASPALAGRASRAGAEGCRDRAGESALAPFLAADACDRNGTAWRRPELHHRATLARSRGRENHARLVRATRTRIHSPAAGHRTDRTNRATVAVLTKGLTRRRGVAERRR
jgi:integrase